jgi:hypothetical protein
MSMPGWKSWFRLNGEPTETADTLVGMEAVYAQEIVAQGAIS